MPLAEEDENSAEITAYPVEAVSKPVEAEEENSSEEKKPGSVVSLDSFRKKH